VNAAIELNSSQATVDLEAATPYELGTPGLINYLYPAYVRGQAYLLAHRAYQDFLTLWKDADPDILILKQAKAECAKPQ
jgi:hypothetical protein